MSFETGMKNVLTVGYTQVASTDEQVTLMKAAKTLRINTKVTGKYVYGDNLAQKSLNTAALTGIDLASTAATGTKVIEAMDNSTFIKSASSSNYTRVTAEAITGETLVDSGDHTTYTTVNTSLSSGRKIYKNDVEVTTGFTVTGTSVVFDSANLEADVITADYSYTVAPYIKQTSGASNAVVVSNNYTVTSNNYVVLKSTVVGGSVDYFVSRDGGTTFSQVYPNDGVILFNQPTGTDFCFKVVIKGGAKVKAVGFSLR